MRRNLTARERGYLSARDVAVLFGEERARQQGKDPADAEPVSVKTVWAFVSHSRMDGGRYQDFPMPLPEYPNPHLPPSGQHAQWFPRAGQTVEDLERELRRWWRERPRVHTETPAAVRRAEIAEVVRAQAGLGVRDQDIAAVLNERFGTTAKGLPHTAKAVERIRIRHGILGGAFNRDRWHGDANPSGTDEVPA